MLLGRRNLESRTRWQNPRDGSAERGREEVAVGCCCRKALVGLVAEHSWFLIYPSHYFKPLQQLFRRKKTLS